MANVYTMVRIKPLPPNITNDIINLNMTRDELIFNEKKLAYNLEKICKQHIFNFDKIYSYNSKTDDIFNDIGIQMVDNFFKKISSTIFVFGQTGTGKTHTIMGNNKYVGFFKILLEYLTDMKQKVNISIIEIYNDTCYDILNSNNIIYQREDNSGNIHLRGVKQDYIANKSDISRIYYKINTNRKVGISSQNDRSSRSHLQIKITSSSGAFIKILDLAGSERASQSNYMNKNVFRENAEINKSLLTLKECIRGLKNKNSYIPIRGSKLTKLLKDSFTGRCNTYILGTVSQEEKNMVDSISTLNYISDLKYIKKIDNVSLPKISKSNDKKMGESKSSNSIFSRSPYKFSNFSPNYRYIVRNKFKLEDINTKQKYLVDKMQRRKTTKKNKEEFLNLIDKDIAILNSFKKNLL